MSAHQAGQIDVMAQLLDEDFVDVFGYYIDAGKWTPEAMEAAREQYEREQIATAQSESAQEEMRVKYSNPVQVARRF